MEALSFSDQIREAIRQSGRTNHAIARAMGVVPSVVHRFMNGSGMSTSSLDRLADVLGLRVVVRGRNESNRSGRNNQPRGTSR